MNTSRHVTPKTAVNVGARCHRWRRLAIVFIIQLAHIWRQEYRCTTSHRQKLRCARVLWHTLGNTVSQLVRTSHSCGLHVHLVPSCHSIGELGTSQASADHLTKVTPEHFECCESRDEVEKRLLQRCTVETLFLGLTLAIGCAPHRRPSVRFRGSPHRASRSPCTSTLHVAVVCVTVRVALAKESSVGLLRKHDSVLQSCAISSNQRDSWRPSWWKMLGALGCGSSFLTPYAGML